MGWNFRRSANLGPFRINLSKSGIGYSVGGRGFRVGKDAKGRKYRSISLPNTGIYRRDYLGGSKPGSSFTGGQASPNHQPAPTLTPNAAKQNASKNSVSAGRWGLYVAGAILFYFAVRAIF